MIGELSYKNMFKLFPEHKDYLEIYLNLKVFDKIKYKEAQEALEGLTSSLAINTFTRMGFPKNTYIMVDFSTNEKFIPTFALSDDLLNTNTIKDISDCIETSVNSFNENYDTIMQTMQNEMEANLYHQLTKDWKYPFSIGAERNYNPDKKLTRPSKKLVVSAYQVIEHEPNYMVILVDKNHGFYFMVHDITKEEIQELIDNIQYIANQDSDDSNLSYCDSLKITAQELNELVDNFEEEEKLKAKVFLQYFNAEIRKANPLSYLVAVNVLNTIKIDLLQKNEEHQGLVIMLYNNFLSSINNIHNNKNN